MVKILKSLVEKIHKMHDQMDHFSREMEILRKNQLENTRMEMKNTFDDLISKLDAAEELEDLKVDKEKSHNMKHKVKNSRSSKSCSTISRARHICH